mmetsp:Transcript_17773/g.41029  ORF Transcript_17773/g.41029 Transcript_17773/m.41029 type:complete len:473 (-) Transcript_17773:1167-2585(-)
MSWEAPLQKIPHLVDFFAPFPQTLASPRSFLVPKILVANPVSCSLRLGKHHDCPRGGINLKVVGPTAPLLVLGVQHLVTVVPVVSAELRPVRVQHNLVLAAPRRANTVTLVAVGGMHVEDKEQLTLLRHNHLVTLILERDVLVAVFDQEGESLLEAVHGSVKVVEVDVPQVSLVSERPLAASAVVRPVIANARKVDPLGVPKLVAHEVEVSLATERHGEHADHLVHGDTAVNNQVCRSEVGHAVVHLLVHQTEGNGLVANECLVVALAVANNLLLVPPVGERVHNVPHLPLVIGELLEQLDPHVRRSHRKAVVEAKPSLGHGAREGGHPGDILSNRDATGTDRVDKIIGKHQVNAGVHVSGRAEVVVVAVDKGVVHAVVGVENRRNPVKAKPVELVLLEPPTEVGEEEAQNLPGRVVVNARVPQRVVAFRTLMKVLVGCTIEVVDAILHILGSVRVHHVKKHIHSQPVALVN